ncbi:hypothetical protein BDZ89DRAFT_1078118 [Hymenopellis radicata]|nr:hypothetical protein BDZ89DRAFT_1078118 [Hymenopellis radicata]
MVGPYRKAPIALWFAIILDATRAQPVVAIEREIDYFAEWRCQDFEHATETHCSDSTLNCCTEEYISSFTKCIGGHVADGADYGNVEVESHIRGLQQYCERHRQPISLPATAVTASETESSAGQIPPLTCERFLCRVLRLG